MTAAMVRRGGAGELGPDELDLEIDALGALVDTATGLRRSLVALNCGSDVLDRGLELLASIVLEPRFDSGRLAQARDNLAVSLGAEEDDPRSVLEQEWLNLVHGRGALRSRRLTSRMVAAFERDALADFHRRHWKPEGAVIAVSGDVDRGALVGRLNELFGGWEKGGRNDAFEAAADPAAGAKPAATHPGWWYVDRPGSQTATAIGHRGAVFDRWDSRDRWALTLLTEILDGPGAVSRLRSRLQLEEGLAYRVLTYFDLDVVRAEPSAGRPAVGEAGEFRVFLETAPESAADVAAAVLEEFQRLLSDEVPEPELATAKRSVLARFPLLFDRSVTVAGRFAEDALLGRPHEYWAEYRARLQAVTPADVRRAARRFIDPESVALLMVGDWEAVRAGRGARKLNQVLGSPRPVKSGQTK